MNLSLSHTHKETFSLVFLFVLLYMDPNVFRTREHSLSCLSPSLSLLVSRTCASAFSLTHSLSHSLVGTFPEEHAETPALCHPLCRVVALSNTITVPLSLSLSMGDPRCRFAAPSLCVSLSCAHALSVSLSLSPSLSLSFTQTNKE